MGSSEQCLARILQNQGGFPRRWGPLLGFRLPGKAKAGPTRAAPAGWDPTGSRLGVGLIRQSVPNLGIYSARFPLPDSSVGWTLPHGQLILNQSDVPCHGGTGVRTVGRDRPVFRAVTSREIFRVERDDVAGCSVFESEPFEGGVLPRDSARWCFNKQARTCRLREFQ